MKKIEQEMRAEYQRSDFGELERGRFFKEVASGAPMALIEPKLTNGLPTSDAAHAPLPVLPMLGEETARVTGRAKRRSRRHSAE